MPTYEYACSSCNTEWEFEQSIKDAALTECPSCHQQTARRQISKGTGFILKGSGWYSDLYSGSSNKAGTPTESSKPSSETKPSADGGSKSESSTTSPAKSSSDAAGPSATAA